MKTMRGSEIIEIVSNMAQYISNHLDYCSIDIKKEMDYHISSFFMNSRDDIVCHIGMKNIDPDKEYPIGEAMIPIVGLCHETFGHAIQCSQVHFDNTDLAKVLALNYYACQGSCAYYGFRPLYNGEEGTEDEEKLIGNRYWNQPHEIAAQYAGIKSAYWLVSNKYGDTEAENMLCEYVNHRIELDSEFIKPRRLFRGYYSLDQVYDAFEKKFQQSMKNPREYTLASDFASDFKGYLGIKVFADGRGSLLNAVRSKNPVMQDIAMAYAHYHMRRYDAWIMDEISCFENFKFDDYSARTFMDNAIQQHLADIKRQKARLEQLDDYIGNIMTDENQLEGYEDPLS